MAIASAADVVRHLWPHGSRLLDIGCGSGAFVKTLLELGYKASGCEPQAARVAEARAAVEGAEFAQAGAEALPFGDGSFDGTIMVHSLHHVPAELMPRALAEAMRCTEREGYLAVVEPLPEGSFFEVLRLVDDETEIRNQAQACLRQAAGNGLFRHHASYQWTRRQTFRDEQPLLSFIAANDPSRGPAIEQRKHEIAARFREAGTTAEGGICLEQPIRCDVFSGRNQRRHTIPLEAGCKPMTFAVRRS